MENSVSLWEILSSLAAVGQFCVAAWVGWYGYKKYLEEEHIEPSEERIEIFSTTKQTTELRVGEKGLECHIHDIRPGRGGHQWTLKKSDAHPVKVTCVATAKKSGKITIGPRAGWLYSYKLWPDSAKLEKAVHGLVNQVET